MVSYVVTGGMDVVAITAVTSVLSPWLHGAMRQCSAMSNLDMKSYTFGSGNANLHKKMRIWQCSDINDINDTFYLHCTVGATSGG